MWKPGLLDSGDTKVETFLSRSSIIQTRAHFSTTLFSSKATQQQYLVNDKSFSTYASLLLKYSRNCAEPLLEMAALLTSRPHSFKTTTKIKKSSHHSLDNVLLHISVALTTSTSASSVVYLGSEKYTLL